jgi:hypothetical protein
MTSILQKRLEEAIEDLGPDALFVQAIRDQIAAAEKSQSARETYITGGRGSPTCARC